jgi:flagellar FliJ protein
MKKFVFRLETVLDLRKRKEEQVQIKLGEALASLNMEIKKLETLFEKREFYRSEIEKMRAIATRVSEVLMYQDYLDSLEVAIKKQAELVLKMEKLVDEVRLELAECAKQRKIIEKIKENEHEEYVKEFEAKERNILDEFGVITMARKMSAKK